MMTLPPVFRRNLRRCHGGVIDEIRSGSRPCSVRSTESCLAAAIAVTGGLVLTGSREKGAGHQEQVARHCCCDFWTPPTLSAEAQPGAAGDHRRVAVRRRGDAVDV